MDWQKEKTRMEAFRRWVSIELTVWREVGHMTRQQMKEHLHSGARAYHLSKEKAGEVINNTIRA